jgi:sulfite oxidase
LRTLTTVRRSDVAFETPLSELRHPLTPSGSFFVRNHALAIPALSASDYRLRIDGAHGTRRLTLDDLRGLRRVSEVVTLACAGNARTAFEPVPVGIPWGFGAISTARWDGVRLRDLLELAGLGEGAAHVAFDGYDDAPDADRPPYRRSIPLSRALVDGTIVADTMNGEPLAAIHGGPVRLIVGGWTANHSMKWLRRIALAAWPDESHWMINDYRVPGPGGTFEVLESAAPVAVLASPEAGTTCPLDAVLAGIAYGSPAPQRVRIEIDGELAGEAPVRYDDGPYAWGRWTFAARLAAGPNRVVVRPVDAHGAAGPEGATWNAKGYRYDGPHVIDVEAV